MSCRSLLIGALLAAGTALTGLAQADILAVNDGLVVKESDSAPVRGMTMSQVAGKFGDPVSKVPAVGNPPISRWDYPGFVVYFERDHVIHSVVSESAPSSPPGAPPEPSAAAAPASTAAPAPAAALEPAAASPPDAASAPEPTRASPAPAPAAAPSSHAPAATDDAE